MAKNEKTCQEWAERCEEIIADTYQNIRDIRIHIRVLLTEPPTEKLKVVIRDLRQLEKSSRKLGKRAAKLTKHLETAER